VKGLKPQFPANNIVSEAPDEKSPKGRKIYDD